MYKSCSFCGRIHKFNERCEKPRERRTQSEADELRAKNRWHEKSRQVRKKYLCCLVCFDRKKEFVYKGLDVHHITPLAEDPDGLLDDDNLCPLCRACHKKADAENPEYSREYLRSLVSRYRESPPVFEGEEIESFQN